MILTICVAGSPRCPDRRLAGPGGVFVQASVEQVCRLSWQTESSTQESGDRSLCPLGLQVRQTETQHPHQEQATRDRREQQQVFQRIVIKCCYHSDFYEYINLKEKDSNIEIFLNVKVDDIYWGKKTDLSFYFGPFSAPGLQIRDERLIGKLFTAVFSSLSDDLTPL